MKFHIYEIKDKVGLLEKNNDISCPWFELQFGPNLVFAVPEEFVDSFTVAYGPNKELIKPLFKTEGKGGLYLLFEKSGDLKNIEKDIRRYHSVGRYSIVEMSCRLAEKIMQEESHVSIDKVNRSSKVFSIYTPEEYVGQPRSVEADLLKSITADSFLETVTDCLMVSNGSVRQAASQGYKDVKSHLINEFISMGLDVTTQEKIPIVDDRKYNHGETSNLAAKLQVDNEKKQARDLIIVCAHLDSIGDKNDIYDPKQISPGADDNSSGCAGVIEIARAITSSGITPKKDIWFVLFGGEEQGLLGSGWFVDRLDDTDKKRLLAAINLDMIAYQDPDENQDLYIMYGDPIFAPERLPAKKLAQNIVDKGAQHQIRFNEVTINEIRSGNRSSDHQSFKKSKLVAVTVMEGTSYNSNYHKTDDLPDTLNSEYATKIIKMNLAYVASLVF